MMRKAKTLLAIALLAAFSVGAQEYPTRPVRVIVPSTAGGSVDTLARLVGMHLSERWKQQVVIDNRSGAGGRTRAVNRVPACGM